MALVCIYWNWSANSLLLFGFTLLPEARYRDSTGTKLGLRRIELNGRSKTLQNLIKAIVTAYFACFFAARFAGWFLINGYIFVELAAFIGSFLQLWMRRLPLVQRLGNFALITSLLIGNVLRA